MTAFAFVRSWIKASRLTSQSYIALPLIMGQVMAWHITGEWSWAIFAVVQSFGLFDQLYIIYANDYADQETDRDNRTPTIFSGGSRVLVEGSIAPQTLAKAAIVMAGLAMGMALVLALVWQRFWAVPLAALGLLLLWGYSYHPIRLSYRGWGEFLQMVGVGAVLPLLGYLAQAGSFQGFGWPLLAALLPLSLATAISTALPDRASDDRAYKRTVPVRFGSVFATRLVIVLNALGLVAFVIFFHEFAMGACMFARVFFGVSILALIALLPLGPKAVPGSIAIVGFVFMSILVNLSWAGGYIIATLCAGWS